MSFKGRGNREKTQKEKPEFEQQIVDLARVTRVTKGGKQLSFRAVVLIGDRRGRVGYGVDKGKDVQLATTKAFNQAKKNLITIPLRFETIPHMVQAKFGAAKVLLKPAPQGSGIIAGSSIRSVLEMAGVPNVSAKMLGKSGNKMNNIKATFLALQSFKVKIVRKEKKEVATEKLVEKMPEDKNSKKTKVVKEVSKE
ncbi:MAG: 30S ribosomal protein S5 [Candidatus Magasanikbacteria bacterium GW2011_GWC2_37_14]|uniref:Small ribosomal subunit protein uS5 n=1 Tax=Candidatus Magasanikbacteria bacterium GW2011_GWC2_37_14 TaxID=1619046 RepID=A0A0G0JG69_9BACT|nr:MAG: 30S ribosomal protein S5 [Candidatus Magasanikbacteria bacterium GW2011_GWC2_37_14]